MTLKEMASESLRFDWYQATVRQDAYAVDPDRLVGEMCGHLGGADVERSHGLNGYAHQDTIRDGRGVSVARVFHGGSNRWPNALASGDESPAFADMMRREFPGHYLTRADVAHDVQMPGAFNLLQGSCLGVADERGLAISQAGDWHRLEAGRTLYIGSRKAEQFARLYEKGLEQRAKAPTAEVAAAIPSDWVRFELVVKPAKAPRRLALASLSPADMFGVSPWTRDLGARLWALEAPVVERRSLELTKDDETMMWAVRQYGALFARQAARVGGWQALGEQLGRMIESADSGRVVKAELGESGAALLAEAASDHADQARARRTLALASNDETADQVSDDEVSLALSMIAAHRRAAAASASRSLSAAY